jgi:hypothetical protein|tara:strand:+ start:194 stop:397 length:204 start_codon:yes stop_codon:yes gene_type:complete
MKNITYNLVYEKSANGKKEHELYRKIIIVGCYGSNDYNNLGYKAWVPEREGYRNFNYYNVISMEVAL